MNEWWILSSDTSGACLWVVSKHHLALCLQASTKKQKTKCCTVLFCPPAKIGAGSCTCLVERKDKVVSEGGVHTWLRERTGISTLCDITKCWLDGFSYFCSLHWQDGDADYLLEGNDEWILWEEASHLRKLLDCNIFKLSVLWPLHVLPTFSLLCNTHKHKYTAKNNNASNNAIQIPPKFLRSFCTVKRVSPSQVVICSHRF